MALNTWWTGDDTVNDSSGNGHNLTIVTPAYTAGKINDCFQVLVANNNGEIASYETMGGTRTLISVFAWVKSTDTTALGMPIASHWDVNAQRQWRMDLNSGNINDGKFRVILSADGANVVKSYYGSVNLKDGTWHHVGFTYTGTGTGTLKLYVDGYEIAVTKGTDTNSTTLFNSSSKVGMGVSFSAGADFTDYIGYIDEVRIYDSVLSDAEVLALFSGAPRFQINIGDAWKTVAGVQINIGDAWKAVPSAQINIGDAWKAI